MTDQSLYSSHNTTTFTMSSSYPFISLLMIELLKQIKDNRMEKPVQEWAKEIENKYGVEMIERPCIDLSLDETTQAHEYLQLIYTTHGLNLIQNFPRPGGDSYIVKAKELLATLPVDENQEPRGVDRPMYDQMCWQAFCRSIGETVSFEDWHAVYYAHRRTQESKKPEFLAVVRPSKCLILPLPKEWVQKLNTIITKTTLSEVVANYNQVEITRGDIATIMPTDNVGGVTANSRKGWLNDKVVETFLNIMAIAASKHPVTGEKKSILVVNSFAVNKLHSTNPKISANKAGVDASTLPGLDIILFPMYEDNHWTLILALPKKRSLMRYDSKMAQNMKQLLAVRDWINAGTGETVGEWVTSEESCIKQTDNSIGGLFVCINGFILVSGRKPIGIYSQEDSQFLREFVAAVVCKGNYPYPM